MGRSKSFRIENENAFPLTEFPFKFYRNKEIPQMGYVYSSLQENENKVVQHEKGYSLLKHSPNDILSYPLPNGKESNIMLSKGKTISRTSISLIKTHGTQGKLWNRKT